MRSNVFNSKMALFNDSIESLASHLNMTRQTLVSKRDGESEFRRDEIAKIVARYHLTAEETVEMFSLDEGR